MADYVGTIRLFGTTDSFTTQMGELVHRMLKNFIPKLKDYILFWLWKLDISYCNHIFMDKEHNIVIIPNNTIYFIQTMCKYDTVNPRTHADVMVVSGETTPTHPYWWLAPLQNHKSGIMTTRLPKVAFMDELDPDAFGFLDPGQVVQGTHLIPMFALECGMSVLHYGPSLVHPGGEVDDWEEHYVEIECARFINQDMFLQYTHFGIGHPVMLWRIIRDIVVPVNAMDVMDEDISNNEDHEQYDDGQEDSNDEFSDKELEDGDEDDKGEDKDKDEDEDAFDDLSF
ncbi:hypothetical protein BDR06DRAFT_972653 [Suillus hirtellus]|nr:hypothetical protein BDR06DRAFT_972653 [Suillus hirtellus]